MPSLKSVNCYFERSVVYTNIAQRMFKYSDIQYTNLTRDKILNSLIYRTLFYVNILELQTSKNSPVFWLTLIFQFHF